MTRTIASTFARGFAGIALALTLFAAPAAAQPIESIDPDLVIDGDLAGAPVSPPPQAEALPPVDDPTAVPTPRYGEEVLDLPPEADPAVATGPLPDAAPAAPTPTYGQDDLIGAAEGLARLIEGILAEQGEPNGYIVGREGGGAFILGVRYGSGTLYHKVEGNMPVYWTGPSIGPDAGANAGNTFVLVYNLLNTDDLYERFPAGEGQAYLVGGFNASYVRRGDIVLIPIRVGAGLRLGVNAGYLKFSREQRWLPF